MLKWQNVKGDVVLSSLSELMGSLGWTDSLGIIMRAQDAPLILITKDCGDAILEHLKSEDRELGGILIGKIFSLPFRVPHTYPFISIITESVPSLDFKSSSVSLRMESEVWSRLSEFLTGERSVVGWYHSHPGIGAFFSATDRRTQKAFFNNTYSLGVVVDPSRNEWRCYSGPDSEEISPGLTVVKCLPTG